MSVLESAEGPIPRRSFDAACVCDSNEEQELNAATNVATREDVPPDGGYDSTRTGKCVS